ncbi:hypothetical protein Tco_1441552 [Tanacetum coccineum]
MEEMIREWIARQMEAKESMKDRVVELERQNNQGLRNRQAIIENLDRHEFVYKPPSIRNENDKGDIEFIEEDEIQPIQTMPNPNSIMSNSPTILPFLKDSVQIRYIQENVFGNDVLSNHVRGEELKSVDDIELNELDLELAPTCMITYDLELL